MESETVDVYARKLSGIASKSTDLGEVIDDSKLVKKFLKTLPRSKFIHIIASLEHVLDLKFVGFEDVVGRLKAYEERIREEDVDGNDQSKKVMFAKLFGGAGSINGSSGSSGSHGGMIGKTKGKGSSSGFNHGTNG